MFLPFPDIGLVYFMSYRCRKYLPLAGIKKCSAASSLAWGLLFWVHNIHALRVCMDQPLCAAQGEAAAEIWLWRIWNFQPDSFFLLSWGVMLLIISLQRWECEQMKLLTDMVDQTAISRKMKLYWMNRFLKSLWYTRKIGLPSRIISQIKYQTNQPKILYEEIFFMCFRCGFNCGEFNL